MWFFWTYHPKCSLDANVRSSLPHSPKQAVCFTSVINHFLLIDAAAIMKFVALFCLLKHFFFKSSKDSLALCRSDSSQGNRWLWLEELPETARSIQKQIGRGHRKNPASQSRNWSPQRAILERKGQKNSAQPRMNSMLSTCLLIIK